MDDQCYQDLERLSEEHWWFKSRRLILERVLAAKVGYSTTRQVLEIGCGTGANLHFLKRFGALRAIEMKGMARELASGRNACEVRYGSLPDEIPYDEGFDLICLFDVLEHVEDDAAALAAIRSHLATGGRVALTVPAFQFLWSNHDIANHHFRRYTRSKLKKLLLDAGFTVRFASYFNTLLFPIVLARRMIGKLRPNAPQSDFSEPSRLTSMVLGSIFGSERVWLSHFRFPVGLSIIIIAEK